jgi:hypothetical protein
MDKDKLSAKEKALIEEARRLASSRSQPAAAAPQPRPAQSAAERLAALMEAERAESQERKRKMRRYGLGISGAILALFALWVLRASRPRR